MQKVTFIVLVFLLIAEPFSFAFVVRETRSADSKTEPPNVNAKEDILISNATREEFYREALKETISFLNNLFQSQIEYFTKVKGYLQSNVKRVKDIEKYIERLRKAILAESVQEKDKMWRDTFVEFSETAFLLNNEKDTGVSNTRYIEILNESGLEQTTKKFLANVATYFWRIAKVSGKAVGSTIDENIIKWSSD